MKISINNFKSIRSIVEFELMPITVLSGINSSGKSSFIQLLLLLKQTIDLDSANYYLYLKGDLFEVKDYQDIITDKNLGNKLKISFRFDKKELQRVDDPNRIKLFDSFSNYHCIVEISYDYYDGKEYITEFLIKYILPEGSKREQFIKFTTKREDGTYFIITNNELFGKNLWLNPPKITRINYSSIYPTYYETLSIVEDIDRKDQTVSQEIRERQFPNIGGIKGAVDSFFSNISYIGPLRELPKDEYPIRGNHITVGSKGEFVAEVLEGYKNELIEFYKPIFYEDRVEYINEKTTLLKAVKHWMCDVFKIGKDIMPVKIGEVYKIVLVNYSNIQTTIKHVGFGISQILPIIVEGLLMKSNGTLILEQPEIHLHPKIQSLLFDFLYSLTLQEKLVIIETHSDHFITRLRRRVAEDMSNSLPKKINLTFIETQNGEILFRSLDLDEYGSLNYYPDDFIELSNQEMKAIVKAQMKKRIQMK